MPLWQVYHPEGTFATEASKQAFAQDITNIYTTKLNLPAFYVVVNFIPFLPSNMYVGGKPKADKPFIRIVIEHIAVHTNNSESAQRMMTSFIDAALKPHVYDKGYDCEYHADETPRGFWKINGLVPPPHKSDGEKIWFRENAAVPLEDGKL
ncbi:hypothetical protein jhhlp_000643 [Lomentospora prolificans]|uniref:Tautomerase cis-CaaD-like domain-containing protein n=1 Tax=Lomentospora prolificans TaxID=41688 RepID=A0A2N3NJ15_9PEZI|nr:hypothetical protein jhhlp_000643 [Lomentospora prolificans]